jgi:hypothetical protein
MVRKLQYVSSPRSTDQGLSTVFKASFADALEATNGILAHGYAEGLQLKG